MCNAIYEFKPEVHAARHCRQQELRRIFAYCNLVALFRRWRRVPVHQH
jgi:hypothetical protein